MPVAVTLGAVKDEAGEASVGARGLDVELEGLDVELAKLPTVAGPSLKIAAGVLQQRVPSLSDSQQ